MLLLVNVLEHQGDLVFQSYFKFIVILKPNITLFYFIFVICICLIFLSRYLFVSLTVVLVTNYINEIEKKWGGKNLMVPYMIICMTSYATI